MNDNRKYIIRIFIVLIGLIFSIKLFFIQVLDKNYKAAAESNIIHKIVEYPYRGLIFDRNQNLLVYNKPIFDIMVIPSEVGSIDTLEFCAMFNITKEEYIDKYIKARRYSKHLPSVIVGQVSTENFAKVADKMVDFPGFYPKARTVRGYNYEILANVLGYIGEISNKQLQSDTTKYYSSGDYIGISGIESSYEKVMRGKRGVSFKVVNAQRVEKGAFKEGKLDTLSIPGQNITLSIDLTLQQYAEKLMKGKVGSVVIIEPKTGEILSFVSAPTYAPSMLAGDEFSRNFKTLNSDSLKPLFNRPLMAMYPPGSIFKIVQGLVALNEGVIGMHEEIYCDGTLIADHAPPGKYNMQRGITYSSNNFFMRLFRRLIERNPSSNPFVEGPAGLAIWKSSITKFGLGTPLGIDIPNERSGLIPGVDYYNKVYGTGRWKYSTISSLSIGQGEILLNPIQMANLAAIIANRGYYYRPHVVKYVSDPENVNPFYHEKLSTGIDPKYFPVVIDAMQNALMGTAPRAFFKDISICGKTGTAQNPHGEDHSVFMAFAPKEEPQIAISVFVENAGWGGRAAATIASLLIEKHITGEVSRTALENYVLKGDFSDGH